MDKTTVPAKNYNVSLSSFFRFAKLALQVAKKRRKTWNSTGHY